MYLNRPPLNPVVRTVCLMRHLRQMTHLDRPPTDWGMNDPLDWSEALPHAERIRAFLTGMDFAYCGYSAALRTLQTAGVCLPSPPNSMEQLIGLTPPDYENAEIWKRIAKCESMTPQALAKADPQLFANCGLQMAGVIHTVVTGVIGPGEAALLVTHSPLCEAALSSFVGLGQLNFELFAKGDMAWFEFDVVDGKVKLTSFPRIFPL